MTAKEEEARAGEGVGHVRGASGKPPTLIVGPQAAPGKLLAAALAYAARGWPVLPLWWPASGGCACGKADYGTPAKHPLGKVVPNGVTDATTDAATIRRWWAQFPMANVGIATGQRSGLVVLDVDPAKGGEEGLRDLEAQHGPLPATVMALTGGGGTHYLFRHPGWLVQNSVGQLGPGLDMRGEGGYIVAPPSLHVSGQCYEWELGHSPDDIPLARLPQAIAERLRQNEVVPDGQPFATEMALAGVPEGKRDETLFRLACKLRRADVPRDMAERLVLEAAANCQPPFPQKTALAKVASAYDRYRPAQEPPEGRANGEAIPVQVCLADVPREEVEWEWESRLPRSRIVLLEGDPGVGKSWLALAIASAITTGAPFPGQAASRDPANVLLVTAEDGLGDTVRPHLEDMGGDLGRVTVLQAVREQGKERHLSLVNDLPHVETMLAKGVTDWW